VLAFLETDSMAGQAEGSILASLAEHVAPDVHVVIVGLETPDRRELVQGFVRFFNEKSKCHPGVEACRLLGAMADKDMLIGQGPFGDVRGLTVIVLDSTGKVALRKSGVVTMSEIARALSAL
jgi:hypothetical protein